MKKQSQCSGVSIVIVVLSQHFRTIYLIVSVSRFVYTFAEIVRAGREGRLHLDFPPEVLEKYIDERLDVRDLNGGNGLSFNRIAQLIRAHEEVLPEVTGESYGEFEAGIIAQMKAIEDEDPTSDSISLLTFSSLKQAQQCVYGVLKDE